ncbi:DUF4249 domain-containing protein [Marixanthomonas sp. SCSIO 43207]|uniref:DUF4249 domain-containing protein n=1 Tax=Marixanthomonas sp. SCSIO 43207 TaxID=2779360 RepID=UPI001CAA357F|nr:DUF4249 domain-containing protein [Marixanthomonas sp. SCSIO 43207]UAB80221.1 DUF4249 domain-containing protein [Marixanthomonas sp. SCSIO 43207]
MKKTLLLIVCLGIFFSCEDVIDVDLNEGKPRLVIDAEIVKGYESNTSIARVKLSTTVPFFDSEINLVNNATVTITDQNGMVYTLENSSNGFYTYQDIDPQPNTDYTLEVIYNNETYTATEQLQPVVPLEFVEQRNDGGFDGETIELKAFFTDPADEQNNYFFEGISSKGNVYDTFNDKFFNGNSIFGLYVNEDIEPGDSVTFYLYGVDEQFYNYMFILLQQGSDDTGGPFETQPATVRGNIINETTPENYPFGYFRISETSILSYTVQ